jgi:hypothetical protein
MYKVSRKTREVTFITGKTKILDVDRDYTKGGENNFSCRSSVSGKII